MTQDVKQWLGEIKQLQQKLEVAHQERDEAFASAANWRSLYETEAQQRRTETALSQRAVAELKAAAQQVQQPPVGETSTRVSTAIQTQVDSLKTLDELRQQLTAALVECDRLTQALSAERTKHDQTRKALTSALGDTVDMLTKERATRQESDG